ncbi:MAG: VOC family protein [Actinomycetota bacterium]|nr:VOC family protein [Actinomycetota bacterium]MDZ4179705.1 VOC family protein [Coriobacteriia bacterium]
MQSVHPYLNFRGDAEQAFELYRNVFGTEPLGLLRFRDFADNAMGVSEADLDKIAHFALPLAPGVNLMGSDVVGEDAAAFVPGNNNYIYLEADSAEEAQRLFEALSDGGRIEMPLMGTDWAEQYGVCNDPFGVHWMVAYTGDVEFELG